MALNLPAGSFEAEDSEGGVFLYDRKGQLFDGTKATKQEFENQLANLESKSQARRKARRAAKQKAVEELRSAFEPIKVLDMEEFLDQQEEFLVLSLLPAQILELARLGKGMVAGIEPALEARAEIASAVYATGIALGVLNPPSHPKGAGIGVHFSEFSGCPNPDFLPNYYRVNGSAEFHSEIVTAIARYVSPQNYLRCRTVGSTTSGLPTSTDLDGCIYDALGRCSSTHPRIYVLNGSFGLGPKPGQFYDDGLYRTYDREWDNFVYNNGVSTFKSAGNRGSSNGFLTSPGQGLNVFSVGAFDHQTFSIWGGSSYRDPETGNMKPEFVAPGVSITAGGHTETGTSLPAPHAAGFAADLISEFLNLRLRPHLLRAAMVAGADVAVSGRPDKVGLGGINYLSATTTPLTISTQASGPVINVPWLAGGNSAWNTFDANDWGGANGTVDVLVTGIQEGERYRIAIAWTTRGSYTYANRAAAHPIGIDLAMQLYDHANQYLGGSFDNSFEYLDFIATTQGPYLLKISRFANRDTNCKLEIGVWGSASRGVQ